MLFIYSFVYLAPWSLSSACELSVVACGSSFPDQGWNLGPLHGEHRVLASGPPEYYTQYASKLGKISSGYRTRKDQFSVHSQRKAVPKNVQTTIQLHSFNTLEK